MIYHYVSSVIDSEWWNIIYLFIYFLLLLFFFGTLKMLKVNEELLVIGDWLSGHDDVGIW